MADKKKQSAVVVVATVMSITSVLSPVATVYAADAEATVVQQTESTEIRGNAPPITLPQELSGNDGQALQDIALPDGWSWTDGNTIISKEKPEYPARIAVDDKTYDYSAVEGYNAEEHFVEENIPVTVLVPETEESKALSSKAQVQAPQANSISSNTGEVEINSTDFPDEKFREYLLNKFDGDSDGKIAIAKVIEIDVSDRTDITDLKGVEKFTALRFLHCDNTGITALNVSQNTELEKLYCYNTGIGDLDVSKNTALTFLDCSDTYIQSLNVSKNIALTSLNCSDTYIQSLNVSKNTALTYFDCFGTEIQTLDVGKITALTHLDCHNTEIQTLDVSKITALTYLDCSGTRITALDVSKNTQLKTLYCDNTGITALNVSKNIKLKTLYCSSTEILSLDVSKSPDLENLDTRYTNLAYLDWGTADLSTWYKTSSTIDLTVNGDTFDITKTFAGIDISKLTIISGGRLDGNNITDYKVGTSIQYTYVCGNVNGSSDTLTVTLNLSKSDSKIKITSNPNMTYTGNPVVNPSVDSKGSTGDVIYTYEIANGNTWDKYTGNPTNVGKYRVTAHLVEDDFNKAAEATKEFTISQATNDWTESIAMTGWMYGEKTVSPTAKAKFGDVTFTYSDSEKGTYTDTVPTDAGTWYVKTAVEGTKNYTDLENIIAFTIARKGIDNINISDINNAEDIDNLIVKDGNKELEKDRDYLLEKKQEGNKVIVTITLQGNYVGSITRTYTIEASKDTGSVLTGDNNQEGFFTMISILSVACLTFLADKKSKNNRKENKG